MPPLVLPLTVVPPLPALLLRQLPSGLPAELLLLEMRLPFGLKLVLLLLSAWLPSPLLQRISL